MTLRAIVRKEIGFQEKPFGIKMIWRLFATSIVKENETNSRNFNQYASKMGTSIGILVSNFAQVPSNHDAGKEY